MALLYLRIKYSQISFITLLRPNVPGLCAIRSKLQHPYLQYNRYEVLRQALLRNLST